MKIASVFAFVAAVALVACRPVAVTTTPGPTTSSNQAPRPDSARSPRQTRDSIRAEHAVQQQAIRRLDTAKVSAQLPDSPPETLFIRTPDYGEAKNAELVNAGKVENMLTLFACADAADRKAFTDEIMARRVASPSERIRGADYGVWSQTHRNRIVRWMKSVEDWGAQHQLGCPDSIRVLGTGSRRIVYDDPSQITGQVDYYHVDIGNQTIVRASADPFVVGGIPDKPSILRILRNKNSREYKRLMDCLKNSGMSDAQVQEYLSYLEKGDWEFTDAPKVLDVNSSCKGSPGLNFVVQPGKNEKALRAIRVPLNDAIVYAFGYCGNTGTPPQADEFFVIRQVTHPVRGLTVTKAVAENANSGLRSSITIDTKHEGAFFRISGIKNVGSAPLTNVKIRDEWPGDLRLQSNISKAPIISGLLDRGYNLGTLAIGDTSQSMQLFFTPVKPGGPYTNCVYVSADGVSEVHSCADVTVNAPPSGGGFCRGKWMPVCIIAALGVACGIETFTNAKPCGHAKVVSPPPTNTKPSGQPGTCTGPNCNVVPYDNSRYLYAQPAYRPPGLVSIAVPWFTPRPLR